MEVEGLMHSYNILLNIKKNQIIELTGLYSMHAINLRTTINAEIEILKLVIKDLKKLK